MSERLLPFKPIIPGNILKREIEARNWTAADLAEKSGLPLADIEQIIKGEKVITPEISAQISSVFDISKDFWYGLQQYHDETVAYHASRAATVG